MLLLIASFENKSQFFRGVESILCAISLKWREEIKREGGEREGYIFLSPFLHYLPLLPSLSLWPKAGKWARQCKAEDMKIEK